MKTKLWMGIVVIGAIALLAPAQAQVVPDAEKEAVIRTAMDYAEGYFSGAPERMERALHYDLNKVFVDTVPKTGKRALTYSTFSGLVEATRAKGGLLDPEMRKLTGYALRVNGNIACAKITSSQFNDFLQMVKFDGQWKIVNVLWAPGPDARNRPALPVYDPAKDDQVILAAGRDLFEGLMTGDSVRAEKYLHPEVCAAGVVTLPTGKTAVFRSRYSMLVERLRAGVNNNPEAAAKAVFKIIDAMDGMAFVEIDSPAGLAYLQMNVIDGEWKVINILQRPAAPPRPPQK